MKMETPQISLKARGTPHGLLAGKTMALMVALTQILQKMAVLKVKIHQALALFLP
jgi:hypothetical protein